MYRTFAQAHLGVPAIRLDFSEKLIVLHHACAPRAMVVQVDKAPVAKALRKGGNVLGENVRVDVYHQGLRMHRSRNRGSWAKIGKRYLCTLNPL